MKGENLMLLVVDDNKDIRDLISHILTLNGFEVCEAPEGQTALAIITKSRPDLVLLDVMMPGLSGYEVLEQVRNSPEAEISGIPILLITARSQNSDIEAGLGSGANDYLIKPFRPAELLAKVNQVLALRSKDPV